MATMPSYSYGGFEHRRFEFMVPSDDIMPLDELSKVKKELELLKLSDPFNVVEMSLETQTEKQKVADAMLARDAAVERLSEAYSSLREKTSLIDRLQREFKAQALHETSFNQRTASPAQAFQVAESKKLKQEIATLEGIVRSLREEIRVLKEGHRVATTDPPPGYDDNSSQNCSDNDPNTNVALLRSDVGTLPVATPPVLSRASSYGSGGTAYSPRSFSQFDNSGMDQKSNRPASSTKGVENQDVNIDRTTLIATLPLPPDPPANTLSPIMLPSPITLNEFLNNTPGPLRTPLANHRILQEFTTYWCPTREEHGYFLTPIYKCNTNPRVAMAHRWTAVDVMVKLNRSVECFYTENGRCYYAGTYKAFRLEDIGVKEWEALSQDAQTAIVKETISGRKNTTPQNVYETRELYGVGALKVACIGMQCVGYNKPLYAMILEQVNKCIQAQTLKWKNAPGEGTAGSPSTAAVSGGGQVGIGPGTVFNASAASGGSGMNDAVEGIASMTVGRQEVENNPVQGGAGRGKR